MRIAYLAQSYPPMVSGAAISARQTAESMSGRGHQVLVLAASDREYPYSTSKDGLTVFRLRSFNNPMRVGQRLVACPRHKTLKLLDQFQPDVIHAHEPVQMGLLALEYAKRTHIPVTITAHQLPWFVASYLPSALKPSVEKILWAYARIVLSRYTALIAPTPTIARIIAKKTGIKSNVISYGVEPETFHPPHSSDNGTVARARLNLPANAPVILHTGRLDTDKSVDTVIRAVAQPIRESEAHLIVVGDGCQKNHLIQLCRELGIEKRVHFTGYIQPANLPEIYRLANVFVTASEIETQGIVLLEAAASGLPIVAVNATCIPEIVHDRCNGFLINPGDITTFGTAILALLTDPDQAQAMGREGCSIAKAHHIHNTWALHEKLYLEMIKQTNAQHITKVFCYRSSR